MSTLPEALRPWAAHLSLFPEDLALSLGHHVARQAAVAEKRRRYTSQQVGHRGAREGASAVPRVESRAGGGRAMFRWRACRSIAPRNADADGTAGITSTTPLLFAAKDITGLLTCDASASRVAVQPPPPAPQA